MSVVRGWGLACQKAGHHFWQGWAGSVASEARLCRGLSLATASGGMRGWLCKMS